MKEILKIRVEQPTPELDEIADKMYEQCEIEDFKDLIKPIYSFDANQVEYYINICGKLVPVVHGGDWVKFEDFAQLLQCYLNLKIRKK